MTPPTTRPSTARRTPVGPARCRTTRRDGPDRIGGPSIELHLQGLRDWASRTGSLESPSAVAPPWPEAETHGRLRPKADR